MSIELKIPEVGESIQSVQIGKWRKQEGDHVELDEEIVEVETDKASVDLPAPAAGVIAKILKRDGEQAKVGEAVALIDETNGESKKDQQTEKAKEAPAQKKAEERAERGEPKPREKEEPEDKQEPEDKEQYEREAERETAELPEGVSQRRREIEPEDEEHEIAITPSARRELRKHGLTAKQVQPDATRLRRKDVLKYLEEQQQQPSGEEEPAEAREAEVPEEEAEARETGGQAISRREAPARPPAGPPSREQARSSLEEIKPLSWIRQRIGERLVAAQQNAALLTTFNEVDMSRVLELRRQYGQAFQEKHHAKLGFMSFFIKALIEALREFPELNAEIRGSDIVYRHYHDIGIAIGSGRGLVVPIIRHAERLGFAGLENSIADFARRAQENKLKPEELQGGTFTISNGGVYGSLLSTPIVNPPQSGVLGLHAMEDRPVARDGQVVIRPMMYLALTYDHRIVDGREAVTFLRRIKERIEEPARMMLDV